MIIILVVGEFTLYTTPVLERRHAIMQRITVVELGRSLPLAAEHLHALGWLTILGL